MSYEEKGAWVYLVVLVGVYAGYVAVILGRADGGALVEVAYRAPMLWSMGVAVVAAVVGRIAVELVKPSETYQTDVRDKDIEWHGERVGGSALAIAMLVPFGLTLLEADHFWIANAIYAAFVLSQLVSTPAKLVAYRRGL